MGLPLGSLSTGERTALLQDRELVQRSWRAIAKPAKKVPSIFAETNVRHLVEPLTGRLGRTVQLIAAKGGRRGKK